MPAKKGKRPQSPAGAPGFLGRLLAAVAVVLCIAEASVAPDYPVKNARPTFDEVHYLHLYRYGWSSVTDGTTGSYYASKSLPVLIIRNLFGYTPEAGWDFTSWYHDTIFFNWLCIGFTAWVVLRVLRRNKLKPLIPIALVLLVCNRAFLDFYIYYPRLPDIFMMALGSWILLGHFERRPWMLWSGLLLSTMTAPQLTIFSFFCLAFPRTEETAPTPDQGVRTQAFWAAVFAIPIIATGLYALYVIPEKSVAVAEAWQNPKYFKSPVVVFASVLATAVVLFWAAMPLRFYSVSRYLKSLSVKHAAAALALASLATRLIGKAAPAVKAGQDASFALQGIPIKMSYFLSKPGPPGLPSQVIFYGLVAVVAILHWKAFCRWVASQGAGFTLAFCFSLMFFGLDGEVRHVTYLLPVFVIGCCVAAAPTLLSIGGSTLIWLELLLSLNWIVFLQIDPTYVGERHLSAFGMCWSPIHYVAALAITVATIAAFRWTSLRAVARR